MEEIFRKKYYSCKTDNFKLQEINCIHWKNEEDTCKKLCSLNLFESPTLKNCMNCQSRKSYPQEVLEEDKKLTTLTVNKTSTEVKPTITAKNVASYANAEFSQFMQGKVDDEIYNERKEMCMGCPSRINNVNNKTDEIGWCNSCGCGIGNDASKLSIKLRKPSLFCPRGKFQPAMGKGFSISDAMDSVTGIFKVVKKAIE